MKNLIEETFSILGIRVIFRFLVLSLMIFLIKEIWTLIIFRYI